LKTKEDAHLVKMNKLNKAIKEAERRNNQNNVEAK